MPLLFSLHTYQNSSPYKNFITSPSCKNTKKHNGKLENVKEQFLRKKKKNSGVAMKEMTRAVFWFLYKSLPTVSPLSLIITHHYSPPPSSPLNNLRSVLFDPIRFPALISNPLTKTMTFLSWQNISVPSASALDSSGILYRNPWRQQLWSPIP